MYKIKSKCILAIISLIVILKYGKYYICTFVNESCIDHFKAQYIGSNNISSDVSYELNRMDITQQNLSSS